ncbi:UDP-glucuronosyltransferase 2B18 [Lonchura striata]|uniref:glucuronosyltransferase n=1 Tax=Lonchura striata TaxID=40157 RepID=A0A218UMI0_9PASE|nr:UDP-glucuronosyltransferase 2B18 [Lonchura striata domestica]
MAMKTTSSKKYLQLLIFQVALLGPVFCGKILVWPTEGSHWMNMNVMVQELIRRGHSFTILVPNTTLFIEPRPKTTEKFEIYNVPFDKDLPETLLNDIVDLWLNNRPTILTFWQFYKELGRLSVGWQKMNKMMCDAVLTNQELMARLQGSGFDLLLSDAVTPCGELLALKLDIPFVYSLRFSPAFTLERHCGKIPAPPSYTPAALSELTDHMSFGERVKNFVSYHLQDYVFQSYWGHWDNYYSKVLGKPSDTSLLVIQSVLMTCRTRNPPGSQSQERGQAMAGKEVAVLLLLAVLGWGSGEKVLVWPADNSHWLNMEHILQELVARGHEVTVLLPSCFLIVNPTQLSPFQFEVIEVPITKKEMSDFMDKMFYFFFNEDRKLPIWKSTYEIAQMVLQMKNITKIICDGVVKNEALMERLRASAFDVLLADPLFPSGELVAEKLGIPFVYTFRFSMGNTVERICGTLPAPPSYVPTTLTSLTDRMTFWQRLKNILGYALHDFMFHYVLWTSWDQYYSEVLGKAALFPEITSAMHTRSDQSCTWNAEMLGPKFPWLLWAYTCCCSTVFCGRVVVWPTDASHWINVKVLLQELVLRGHEVTVLVPSSNLLINYQDTSSPFTFEVLQVPFSQETLDAAMEDFLNFWTNEASNLFPWEIMWTMKEQLEDFTNMLKQTCDTLVMNSHLIAKLQRAKFDVLIADPVSVGGELVAEILEIPFVYSFRFSDGNVEMEEFVQSSGEHGVIVFTLGSMVHSLSDEKSNVIAKALSQLPQKVLWRYKGKKPETLGSNTRIFDWIPQNDLLGHPLTKAFITHGGTNGLYEAIYHGIPMVGIPMFADQHDNLVHMVAKGAAVQVDFNTMKTQDLVDALKTVIYNSTYKENALKLSKIQHDQPVKPLDRAVFWIEFVMRHKGAKHLRPAAHHLTWYQYHSLDVLAFLFTCTATIIFILFKCCLCCCRRCGRIAKRKKE